MTECDLLCNHKALVLCVSQKSAPKQRSTIESSSARPPGRPSSARTTSGYELFPVFIDALQHSVSGKVLCAACHSYTLTVACGAVSAPHHALYREVSQVRDNKNEYSCKAKAEQRISTRQRCHPCIINTICKLVTASAASAGGETNKHSAPAPKIVFASITMQATALPLCSCKPACVPAGALLGTSLLCSAAKCNSGSVAWSFVSLLCRAAETISEHLAGKNR